MTTDDAQNPAALAGTPSALFTTEPMITRALAAEIRHYPALFTKLLEERLGYPPGGLGAFLDVACEKSEDADTDVRVRFRSGADIRRIAIEGKLDHFVGAEQIDKQNDANLTHVVLVVLRIEDVPDFVDTDRNPVIVWDEAIACFPDSRLTLVDIGSVDDAKARARRLLRTADLSQLPSDWDIVRRENGNGDPCIVIESTPLPDGRIIRGQIQARRKDSKRPGLRFEYHIGISIVRSDDDFPPKSSPVPSWVGHLRTLKNTVEGRTENLRITTASARGSRKAQEERSESEEVLWRKMNLAKLIPDGRWLFHGYTDDWALGVRSLPHNPEDIPALVDLAVTVLNDWWAAEKRSEN